MSKSLEEVKAEQGKMLLQMIGVLLVFTAISVVFQGGMMLSLIMGSGEETQKALQEMAENGFTRELLMGAGASYVVLGITQIVTGVFSFKLANRLDKVKTLRIVAIVFLAISLLQQMYLFLLGASGLAGWISAILMPGILLWALQKNVRLAKADPERIYVIDPQKRPGRNQPRKTSNVMARAKAKVKDEELAARVAGERPEVSPAKEKPARYDDLEFVTAMNAASEEEQSQPADREPDGEPEESANRNTDESAAGEPKEQERDEAEEEKSETQNL